MYEGCHGHQLFMETQVTHISFAAVQQEEFLALAVHPAKVCDVGMGPIMGGTWGWKKRSCKHAAESSFLHYAALANQGSQKPEAVCFCGSATNHLLFILSLFKSL